MAYFFPAGVDFGTFLNILTRIYHRIFNAIASAIPRCKLVDTVAYQNYLYRLQLPLIFLHIYLLFVESTL